MTVQPAVGWKSVKVKRDWKVRLAEQWTGRPVGRHYAVQTSVPLRPIRILPSSITFNGQLEEGVKNGSCSTSTSRPPFFGDIMSSE